MPTFASQARPNLTNLVKNRDRRNSVKTSFNDARKTVGANPKLKKTETSELTATASAPAGPSGLARHGPKIVPVKSSRPQLVVRMCDYFYHIVCSESCVYN